VTKAGLLEADAVGDLLSPCCADRTISAWTRIRPEARDPSRPAKPSIAARLSDDAAELYQRTRVVEAAHGLAVGSPTLVRALATTWRTRSGRLIAFPRRDFLAMSSM
jgi:hypothetical protein